MTAQTPIQTHLSSNATPTLVFNALLVAGRWAGQNVFLMTLGWDERVIAELQRAKRASGAPWVRKFGKPPSRENLVIT